jgi:hypothetical protein
MITITRYGTRNWAVYLNDELVAVTLYRKGACRIAELLSALPQLSPAS